jgi:hypothetical protein
MMSRSGNAIGRGIQGDRSASFRKVVALKAAVVIPQHGSVDTIATSSRTFEQIKKSNNNSDPSRFI